MEMPQARASIGFSSEPRMRSPIEVRVRKAQLAPITTKVVTMITARQIENSRPPTVTAPASGSSIDL